MVSLKLGGQVPVKPEAAWNDQETGRVPTDLVFTSPGRRTTFRRPHAHATRNVPPTEPPRAAKWLRRRFLFLY